MLLLGRPFECLIDENYELVRAIKSGQASRRDLWALRSLLFGIAYLLYWIVQRSETCGIFTIAVLVAKRRLGIESFALLMDRHCHQALRLGIIATGVHPQLREILKDTINSHMGVD